MIVGIRVVGPTTFALAFGAGCDRFDLTWRYDALLAGTLVTARADPEDPDACGEPDPPYRTRAHYVLGQRNGGELGIVDLDSGCSLHGVERHEDAFVAEAAECLWASGPDDAAITDRRYEVVRMDPERGTLLAHMITSGVHANGTRWHTCELLEAETSEWTPQHEGVRRLAYQGSEEQRLVEGDGCGPVRRSVVTAGIVTLTPTPDGSTVREEASGCTVALRREAEGVYVADPGAPCVLEGEVSLSDLGVTSRVFDELRIDLAAGVLVHRSRQTWEGSAGPTASCREVVADLAPADP